MEPASASMCAIAASYDALFCPNTASSPSSLIIDTLAPVSFSKALMFDPCGPMSLPMSDGGMDARPKRGALSFNSFFGDDTARSMTSITRWRASLARSMASIKISSGMPSGLQSSWIPVTPDRVPAILKSISPSTSSRPMMSSMSAYRFTSPESSSSSIISPIEMAPTCSVIGTPASMSAMEPEHTAAIEDEPLLSSVSAFTRTANGNVASSGNTANNDFSASAPWPTSRRLIPRPPPVSLTEKEGNE
mmetsp:Transcript_7440/g.16638  ORF Transcript_7440/g.16638 Transcript_7440/m.16638 type:complete len:248 (+) Transcript_7440:316-1059(+)